MGDLLTPDEAAQRLRVCTKTLRRLRQAGAIRYVAVTKRKIFYRPEDCAAFIEQRATVSEPVERPRNNAKPNRRRGGNVVSFTARRRERLGG